MNGYYTLFGRTSLRVLRALIIMQLASITCKSRNGSQSLFELPLIESLVHVCPVDWQVPIDSTYIQHMLLNRSLWTPFLTPRSADEIHLSQLSSNSVFTVAKADQNDESKEEHRVARVNFKLELNSPKIKNQQGTESVVMIIKNLAKLKIPQSISPCFLDAWLIQS